MMNSLPSVNSIITLIQKEAFSAIGMDADEVKSFFAKEEHRVSSFFRKNPNYLQDRDSILEEDASLTYIELDLSKRFKVQVPTPFQHPYLYSWLQDNWRYHFEKTYGQSKVLEKDIVLATAPTGRFNAIALSGETEHGIIIEDGLVNVLVSITNELAFLLFEKIDTRKFQERTLAEIKTYAQENPQYLERITSIILDYVVDGYSRIPAPTAMTPDEDFSIRHVLSSACWAFVFEHELFHLKVNDGKEQGLNRELLENRYQQIWKVFEAQINPVLPEPLDEMSFKKRYLAHQEELFADYFAFCAVVQSGMKENTLSSSIIGAFTFFLVAELNELLVAELKESGSFEPLYKADGINLALTAIVMKESHPYAFARRLALLSGVNIHFPSQFAMVQEQSEKIDLIVELLKSTIKAVFLNLDQKPVPHSKWEFGRSISGNYLYVK